MRRSPVRIRSRAPGNIRARQRAGPELLDLAHAQPLALSSLKGSVAARFKLVLGSKVPISLTTEFEPIDAATWKEIEMSTTVTGKFASGDQARNVKDDLVSSGIPVEKIYVDDTAKTIKVIMPTATQPTILEIFERHGLSALTP